MEIYALICEAHSDDDRLLGLYTSIDAARDAHRKWEDWPLYPFYRIERRVLDEAAVEWREGIVVED